MKRTIIIAALFSAPYYLNASDPYVLTKALVRHRAELGDLRLIKSDSGYVVQNDVGYHEIPDHNVPTLLKDLSREHFDALESAQALIQLTQQDNGDYRLDADGKVLGGGPKAAKFFKWGVQFGGKVAVWFVARKVVNRVATSSGLSNTASAAMDAASARVNPGVGFASHLMDDLPAAAQDAVEEGVAGVFASAAGNTSTINKWVDRLANVAYKIGYMIPWLP